MLYLYIYFFWKYLLTQWWRSKKKKKFSFTIITIRILEMKNLGDKNINFCVIDSFNFSFDTRISWKIIDLIPTEKDLLLLHSTMVVHNSTKKTRSTSEERTNSSSVASECEPFSNQKFELFRQNHHTGLLQCIECQAGPFSSRSKLLKHLMTHNEEQKRCQKCKILHPSISSAQNHICGHSTTTTSDNTVSQIFFKLSAIFFFWTFM